MIYLDYAANTPIDSEVMDTFQQVSLNYLANPNASHRLGLLAKEQVDLATERIAQLLDIKSTEIIYTSGATEANNLAIKGLTQHYKRHGKHIITTYLEHASVTSPIMALQQQGYEVDFVDIKPDGCIDLNHLRELLREDTVLVSIGYVDSELGIQQPIDCIGKLLLNYPKCYFHVDATQAIGKIPITLETVDLMTFSPHKFYGLNGCGVLIKKEGITLEPLIHGGMSTTPYRSGSPTLALIVATEKALSLALDHMPLRYESIQNLNQMLRKELMQYPEVRINSSDQAIPHILNISLRGLSGKAFQKELENHDIYVATKAACSTPMTPSRPVYAVTKDRKLALSTLRMSLSHLTTEAEITQFLAAFKLCYTKLKK